MVSIGFYIGLATFILCVSLVLTIKSRYRKYDTTFFIQRLRDGKVISEGYGGGYLSLPFIDEFKVVDLSVQHQQFSIGPFTSNMDKIVVNLQFGIIWKINDPKSVMSNFYSEEGIMNDLREKIKLISKTQVNQIIRNIALYKISNSKTQVEIEEQVMFELKNVLSEFSIEFQKVGILDANLSNN